MPATSDKKYTFFVNKLKKPKYTFYLAADQDGDVWIGVESCARPAMKVFMWATYDGESLIRNGGHVYVRLDWAQRELHPGAPDWQELCDKIRNDVREAQRAES